MTESRKIDKGNPKHVIQTDSSIQAWGYSFNDQTGGGRWSKQESKSHINVLELGAILLSIKSPKNKIKNSHVKILSDSSTTVCYVTNMGGCKSLECDVVAKEIWNFCIDNGTWLSIAHTPGIANAADKPSREFNNKLKWEIGENPQSICLHQDLITRLAITVH